MAETETTETQVVSAFPTYKKAKKLTKPARKQVKPGEVEHKEPEQSGKEYSACHVLVISTYLTQIRYLVQQMGWWR